MRAAMLAGGWLYAAAIVYLSLAPKLPVSVPLFEYSDKLAHLLAYAGLMMIFAWVYRTPAARLGYAALWIGMGIGLEFLQGAGGSRSYEVADMVANALGVAAGAAAALILPRGAAAAERETPSAGR